MVRVFDPERCRRRLTSVLARPRVRLSPDPELELGTTENGAPFGVPVSAFDRHAQIIGTTGGGKTRFLLNLFSQFAEQREGCCVFLDPTGNAYELAKRWVYSRNLEHRLVLIDPSEQRLVVGLNPLSPWEEELQPLQARLAAENMRRTMSDNTNRSMPLLEQWLRNTFHAVIARGLTLHEAPHLLSFHDGRIRDAILKDLPDGHTARDFRLLKSLIEDQRPPAAMREWLVHASAAYRRFADYSWNPLMENILSSVEGVLDWEQVIAGHKLVLVNLNPTRNRRPVLALEERRMLGLQIISSIIDVCTTQKTALGEGLPPTHLIVDEAQHFISENLETILSEGRQFNLRLILAHRSPAELIDEQRDSDKLLRLVASCTQFKAVFGGLDWHDIEPIAWNIAGHFLDPDLVKDEIWSKIQLSKVVEVEDESFSTTEAHHQATGESSSRADGYSDASGHSAGLHETLADDGTEHLHSTGSASSSGFSTAAGSGFSSVEGSSSSNGRSVTRHLAVHPLEPELQLSSRTYASLDEQIHRVMARLVMQPPQFVTIATGKTEAVAIKAADWFDPILTPEQTHSWDPDVMRQYPFYLPPALRQQERDDRQADLLRSRRRTPTPLREVQT